MNKTPIVEPNTNLNKTPVAQPNMAVDTHVEMKPIHTTPQTVVEVKNIHEPKFSYSTLYRYATFNEKILMYIGLFFAVGAGSAIPVMTIVFGEIILLFTLFAAGAKSKDDFLNETVPYTLYFVYLAIGTFVTYYISVSTWMFTGGRQARRIREAYFKALLQQEIAWWDKQNIGSFSVHLESDTLVIQDGISEKVASLVTNLGTFFVGLIIALIRGWQLALPLMSIIPLIAGTITIMNKVSSNAVKRGKEKYQHAAGVAEESISNVRTVKSLDAIAYVSKMYASLLTASRLIDQRKGVIQGVAFGLIFSYVYLTYALAFYYGAVLINNGTVTFGIVINVFQAILLGAFALSQVGPDAEAIVNAIHIGKDLFKTLDQQVGISLSRASGMVPPSLEGQITFDKVTFNYPSRPDVQILDQFDLRVEPGETVALVGESGSGKSSCMALVQRFYDPNEGVIAIDGIPLKDLKLRWWRHQIGVVGQEPVLFDATIYDNVAYGLMSDPEVAAMTNLRTDAIRQKIESACKTANAHEFIMRLPLKYETRVGERGLLLSGGQKQRLCIARAIVKNPRILLLDEATAALDVASERIVQMALDEASKGRTTLVIAHRLSTIQDADRIVVVNKGRVLEQGKHHELLALKGIYHHLATVQQLKGLAKDQSQEPENVDVDAPDLGMRESLQQKKEMTLSVSPLGKSTNDPRPAMMVDDDQGKLVRNVITKIMDLNSPEWPFLMLGFFGAAGSGAIMPVFSIIFGKTIEAFSDPIPEQRTEKANYWAVVYCFLALTAFVVNASQNVGFSWSGCRLSERLRALTFKTLLYQEVAYFDAPHRGTGTLMARLSTDATLVQSVSGTTLGSILQVTVTVIAGIIIGLSNDVLMTLVVLTTVPLSISAGYFRIRLLKEATDRARSAYESSSKLALEVVSAIRTTNSLGLDDVFMKQYDKALERPSQIIDRSALVSSILYAFGNGFQFLANALGFWYGASSIASGRISINQMFTVFYAVIIGGASAGRLFAYSPDLRRALNAARAILALKERKPRIIFPEDNNKTVIQGDIEFNNVSFSYDSTPVLHNISLVIKAGSRVALVGPSGSGKSTMISLLQRHYDVTRGTITIQGQDIRKLSQHTLSSAMAVVSQEPVLFNMSLKENLCFGLNQVTDEAMKLACDQANISSFVDSLPDGMNTILGARGSLVSGGQKQRLCIARALLRQPRILLLDEATSALDGESERVVQEALQVASQGRTTIAVAHRLATIQDYDVIVVLKDGKIVEQGSHGELMKMNGLYASMVEQQRLAMK